MNNLQIIVQNDTMVCICSKYYGLLKVSTNSINTETQFRRGGNHTQFLKVDYFHKVPVILYHDLQCESHQLPRNVWIRITHDMISNSKSNSSSSGMYSDT